MAIRVDHNAILSIDIGTTFLKCSLYDLKFDIISTDSMKLNVLQPRDGYFEINPNELLEQIIKSIKNCLKDNKVVSIRCIGISTQRNSVLLWDKDTGEAYSNFILWNDKRNTNIADSLNYTLSVKTLKLGSRFLSSFVNDHRFITFSKYRYATNHVTPKILWLFENLRKKIDRNKVLFGCIETWILWKLTKQHTYATDWTCGSCTGLFDFYLSSWSSIMCTVSGIPKNILPEVMDTCGNFGTLDKSFINTELDLPITAIIGDAQSSIIAECAFNVGDVVITIGTGAFISVNCGDKPVSSKNENYPLCGYKYLNEKIFILHNVIPSAGISIEWAKSIGLFDDYNEIEEILLSVNDSDGVYFVSSFSSVEIEGKDTKSAASFIGLKPSTKKSHLLRAIFDSIAFGIKEIYESMVKDMNLLNIKTNSIRICGGVARSNFLCRYLANLLNHTIERSPTGYSSSSLGAAICAGIGAGLWLKKEELQQKRKNIEFFEIIKQKSDSNNNLDSDSFEKYLKNTDKDILNWNKAIKRCMNWYE